MFKWNSHGPRRGGADEADSSLAPHGGYPEGTLERPRAGTGAKPLRRRTTYPEGTLERPRAGTGASPYAEDRMVRRPGPHSPSTIGIAQRPTSLLTSSDFSISIGRVGGDGGPATLGQGASTGMDVRPPVN